ncbi:hypothetical protein B6N60_00256 [Richelia sinica FACHB-800]|uniref:Uncharacterized protein n=1 Tax=Richelia sinica FACHB-800 TaxID=1357546 RepID=A0A975T3W6_9NOST|nr:hypothetical protein B6N60_00256 [Richelia sinica FACHB-800]
MEGGLGIGEINTVTCHLFPVTYSLSPATCSLSPI